MSTFSPLRLYSLTLKLSITQRRSSHILDNAGVRGILVKLTDLAAVAGVSRFHFLRTFKRVTDVTQASNGRHAPSMDVACAPAGNSGKYRARTALLAVSGGI
jgi:AraC-like DNA-binding protein